MFRIFDRFFIHYGVEVVEIDLRVVDFGGHLVAARFPDAVQYSVRFGKPLTLPGTAGLYIDEAERGWDIGLRNVAKGYPYLTATVRAL